MATERKKILFRRGNKADLVIANLQPGEPCLALDTNEIGVKTSGGTVLWFATLDANGKAKQDPASYGKAGGGATLNADGKVIQDPASYGRANGGATLNADGKVIQDPASYGKVGGAPLISNLPQSPQLVMLHSDGTLSTAGGLPESDNGKGSRHYTVYPDGRLHEWGYVNDTITITSAYGSMYLYSHYNITLLHNCVGNVSAHINIASSGTLIGVGVAIKSGTQNVLDFNILSPISVSNLPVTFLYDVWGWWRT